MSRAFPPSVAKAWQYSTAKGGLEKSIWMNPYMPTPKPSPDQHLIRIITMALNPIDYKVAEIPLLSRLLINKPAIPGIDFAGCLVTPAEGSHLKQGQLVFGTAGTSYLAGGALAEYAIADTNAVVPIPDGVELTDAATIGVSGLIAYQSIVPNVKEGDKVLINGGSGGTGVFGIQIAKVVGCHVTVTCSTASIDLCKRLGADEVVDYRKGDLLDTLKNIGQKFDHVVDNVGSDRRLYWKCHHYMKPEATFILVGGSYSIKYLMEGIKRRFIPSPLGGIKRKVETILCRYDYKQLEQIGEWMKDGTVRPVIDQRFTFEEAPKAFEKLKTERTKGKIVIQVLS